MAEVAVSLGGYYLLRAGGTGVFWSLMAPAAAVAVIAVTVTALRGQIDLIGLFVLFELGATIVISLATRNPRIAALREPFYLVIAGVFCLATLCYRTPLSHLSTASLASFGDQRRVSAFEDAWQRVPRYRACHRLLTAMLGLIFVAAAAIKAYVVISAASSRISDAMNVSNIITFMMIGALVLTSAILIQPPKKIIEDLLGEQAGPLSPADNDAESGRAGGINEQRSLSRSDAGCTQSPRRGG